MNRKITVTIAVPQYRPANAVILWSSDQEFLDYQDSIDCADMAFKKVPHECGVYRCTVECVPRAEHGEFGTILSEWLEYQVIAAEKILMVGMLISPIEGLQRLDQPEGVLPHMEGEVAGQLSI